MELMATIIRIQMKTQGPSPASLLLTREYPLKDSLVLIQHSKGKDSNERKLEISQKIHSFLSQYLFF